MSNKEQDNLQIKEFCFKIFEVKSFKEPLIIIQNMLANHFFKTLHNMNSSITTFQLILI